MQEWRSIDSLGEIPGPVVLALGVFDGLHLGHQAVIQSARNLAGSLGGVPVLATFDPHPLGVLRPHLSPSLLTSLAHKRLLLPRLGIGHLLVIPFTDAFGKQEPESFVRHLIQAARPLGGIVTGTDYCFGNQRRGTTSLLAQFGNQHGFKTIAVPPVLVHGERVSSTRVRQAVADGDFAAARDLLGRPYSLLGTVTEGRKLGRTIGFPTANLGLQGEQLPPCGVYAARVSFGGTTYPAVANLGTRPTVEISGQPALEAHILDFQGDLYGRELEIEFASRLRGEQRFSDLEALRLAIQSDVSAARRILDHAP